MIFLILSSFLLLFGIALSSIPYILKDYVMKHYMGTEIGNCCKCNEPIYGATFPVFGLLSMQDESVGKILNHLVIPASTKCKCGCIEFNFKTLYTNEDE